MSKQFSLAALLLVVTLLGILCAVWRLFPPGPSAYRITKPVDPFPPVEEIESLSAWLYDFVAVVPEFDVPRKHWQPIRSAMLPAEVDESDLIADWVALGHVTIQANDGQTLDVDLYQTPDDIGAFAVNRKYYRGGNSRRLQAAIEQAHRAATASEQAP